MTVLEPTLVRRSRLTGHEVLLTDHREDRHHDIPASPWKATCGTHRYTGLYTTRQLAVAAMASPNEWCEKCAFEVENGPAPEGEEVCSGCLQRLAPSTYPALGRCGPCRGMSEEEGYLKIPGAAQLDVEDFREFINEGKLEAYLFRKLWRKAPVGEDPATIVAIVQFIVDELAWMVAGDADISKTNIDEYHRLVASAYEEAGDGD